MDCASIKKYIYPFLDGQIDAHTAELVKEHLSACPICGLEFEQEKKIDSLIRSSIPKESAPYELKETILEKIRGLQDKPKHLFIFPLPKPVVRLALSLLFIGLLITPVLININKPFPVFNTSILSHTKFLQGALPIEFASNNPNQIKNWFQGKLDFAFNIPDFSSQGANLAGARLCHLREREAAYLIYEKNGRYISVFIINTKGLRIPKAKKMALDERTFYLKSEKGYQSILCLGKGGDIGCIFVSDLPEDELVKIIT